MVWTGDTPLRVPKRPADDDLLTWLVPYAATMYHQFAHVDGFRGVSRVLSSFGTKLPR